MALTITSAPAIGTLFAAYRPIRVSVGDSVVSGTGAVEVVYCDVHFDGNFFRTITCTAWQIGLSGGWSFVRSFEFDLARAAQEYLKSKPLAPGTLYSAGLGAVASMTLSMRAARRDPITGLLDVGTTVEVQFPEILVLNASMPFTAPASLKNYLTGLKKAALPTTYLAGNPVDLLPLTRRPDYDYRIGRTQSDHFPFIPSWNGLRGTNNPLYLDGTIEYRLRNNPTVLKLRIAGLFYVEALQVNYLPVGLEQLQNLGFAFPAGLLELVESYRVVLATRYNILQNPPVFIEEQYLATNWMTVDVACEDIKRVRFLNLLGCYDAVNFHESAGEQATKSATFQTPLRAMPAAGEKRTRGLNRFNVRSVQTLQVSQSGYRESSAEWLAELADSPEAFLELSAEQFGFSQPADLLPVVIEDAEVPFLKTEERYDYTLALSLRMANDTPRQNP